MFLKNVIESLKEIKLSLLVFEDSNIKSCVLYLKSAIQSLEDYKNNPGQLERQIPPGQAALRGEQNPTKHYTTEGLSNQQTPQCGSGEHWVRRRLKNGKPGYCRKNPKRK